MRMEKVRNKDGGSPEGWHIKGVMDIETSHMKGRAYELASVLVCGETPEQPHARPVV